MWLVINTAIVLIVFLLLLGCVVAHALLKRPATTASDIPSAYRQLIKRQLRLQNDFDQTEVAWYLPAAEVTTRTIILVHDFGTDHRSLATQAVQLHQRGYNVLLPDALACGASAGSYVTLGFQEQTSLRAWIDQLIQDDAHVEIGLWGSGQGAATIGLLSDQHLPKNVQFGILKDCYASTFTAVRQRWQLPWPLTVAVSFATQLMYGFTLNQLAPLDHVKHSRIPLLFLTDTTATPQLKRTTHRLFAATTGTKEQATAPANQPDWTPALQQFLALTNF